MPACRLDDGGEQEGLTSARQRSQTRRAASPRLPAGHGGDVSRHHVLTVWARYRRDQRIRQSCHRAMEQPCRPGSQQPEGHAAEQQRLELELQHVAHDGETGRQRAGRGEGKEVAAESSGEHVFQEAVQSRQRRVRSVGAAAGAQRQVEQGQQPGQQREARQQPAARLPEQRGLPHDNGDDEDDADEDQRGVVPGAQAEREGDSRQQPVVGRLFAPAQEQVKEQRRKESGQAADVGRGRLGPEGGGRGQGEAGEQRRDGPAGQPQRCQIDEQSVAAPASAERD